MCAGLHPVVDPDTVYMSPAGDLVFALVPGGMRCEHVSLFFSLVSPETGPGWTSGFFKGSSGAVFCSHPHSVSIKVLKEMKNYGSRLV